MSKPNMDWLLATELKETLDRAASGSHPAVGG